MGASYLISDDFSNIEDETGLGADKDVLNAQNVKIAQKEGGVFLSFFDHFQ